ncbi:hypothetical protein Q4610_00115 [Sphingobium sp. HBC34]|uniref:DUF6841 domain-containing protein n=1 Tax=Sphingobium cyanobacteriorum TaxID=3063954 RepID=A0ABT8ZFY2_9SPHN|nr:hypothetical protein [Sphingobium sp. HBC34]MDO7833442.1 hypothetical protein [Sphingobium sp. HBC34]
MAENQSVTEISSLLHHYIDLFNAADFETALASYHLPFSWLVGPIVATAFTPDDFITRMTAMRSGLAEQGFERSELVSCTVRMLGPDAALAGVEVVRHFAGDRAAEVTGGTYIAHNDGAGWRLTSIIGHPIADIVS